MQGSDECGRPEPLGEGEAAEASVASPAEHVLHGRRVALVGRLSGMPQREAKPLVERHGGRVVDSLDDGPDLVVVGEDDFLAAKPQHIERLARLAEMQSDADGVELISESDLWQRLGLIDPQSDVRGLYTPAMLADLLGVEVAVVRRWHRRGLIRPVHEVRRLPYFDFQEVTTARRLAELLAAGVSPKSLERQLAALARWLPQVERPLAQLSVIVEGRDLLLRCGDGLVDARGQRRIDFDQAGSAATRSVRVACDTVEQETPPTADALVHMAEQLEDEGQLHAAAEMYRAALAAAGPDAWTCFLLAELLYRLGETGAARERYYMAIELDEDFVEARANLGCVLAEGGELELAAAALRGALKYHPDFPDAHYHLARTLDEMGNREEADAHWRRFLELAPTSPWADVARQRTSQ